jgi:NADH-quinone oxidoreductase subunit G/[NiFe] hydrogenase diaphorase moiety small subunit
MMKYLTVLTEEEMESKEILRAPVSQQSLIIEKPENPEYIGGSVSIEINEKKFSVPLGTTILEACRQNQIHIPTLCHHEDLCVAGVCRICVVEVEGMRTLQASCAFPITAPLKIKQLLMQLESKKARPLIYCLVNIMANVIPFQK